MQDAYACVMTQMLALAEDYYATRYVIRVTHRINALKKRQLITHDFVDQYAQHLKTAFEFYARVRHAATRTDARYPLDIAEYYLLVNDNGGLALKNSHPRDFLIGFFDRAHIHRYVLVVRDATTGDYAAKTNRAWHALPLAEMRSVTGLKADLFTGFDEEANIDRMMADTAKWSDPVANAKYYGMSRQQVLDAWEVNRVGASEEGTAMHANLEAYCNAYGHEPGTPQCDAFPYETASPEFALFKHYEKAYVTPLKLIPYRTEWMIHLAELCLSGSVDILYAYDTWNGMAPGVEREPDDTTVHLVLRDWKRSKRINRRSFRKNGKAVYGNKHCTCDIEECNMEEYRIQLQLYKYMLEANYGVTIDSMAIVVLYPGDTEKNLPQNAEFIDVVWNAQLMADIVSYRAQCVAEQRENPDNLIPRVPAKRKQALLGGGETEEGGETNKKLKLCLS